MLDHRRRVVRGVILAQAFCALGAGRSAESRGLAAQGPPPDSAGHIRRDRMRVDTLDRSFLYYAPPNLESGASLVLVFHGSGGDGSRIRGFVGASLERLADEHAFLVAYPDGYHGNWNDCRGKAPFDANRLDVDDVAFVRALVDRFRRQDGIDPARVYAVGYSNGGHMAYRLALEVPGEIGAVAAFGANLPVPEELDCRRSGRPAPVLAVNGTADPINPYQGGDVTLPDGRSFGHVWPATESVRHFAELAGYRGPPERQEVLGDEGGLSVERIAWQQRGMPGVLLYTVYGGGHTIPSGTAVFPSYLGAVERRFDAVEEAVRFFLSDDAPRAATGGTR
jgi:polyhydroxybutyrate depolymerase